ncbi:MAG: hypothetical protein Q4E33_05625 [Erysipelotrichaceae bacterium]|nr:hypothetical protein [Erysipelotrichaceae bacterium]
MSNKKKTRIISPKEKTIINLFYNACGFKETCFSEIYKMYNPKIVITPLPTGNHCAAIAINGLLAIELFTKYIYAMDRLYIGKKAEYYSGHDFYDLYMKLKRTTQKELKEELFKLGCDDNTFNSFKRKVREGKSYDPIMLRYYDSKYWNNYKFDINTMVKIIDVLYRMSEKRRSDKYFKEKRKKKIVGVNNGQSTSFSILDRFSNDIVNDNYDTIAYVIDGNQS